VLSEIRKLAEQQGLSIRDVSPRELERLVPGHHTQGVAAQIERRHANSLEELLTGAASSGHASFLLFLDQIQDPQNLGSLLRTAEAAGVQGVILPDRGSAPISGVVAKASAGALSHLPVVEVVNLARAIRQVREAGLWVVGLEGSASQPLFTADLSVPLALVVGSEGSGLRRLTRDLCDLLVCLPMLGVIENLNAAVAGSIAMYEVVRQRTVHKGRCP
jgi:23S rRNA (guanosine2251-2'-O)-methyltransferase